MDSATFAPATSPDTAVNPYTHQQFEQMQSPSELRTHHHHHHHRHRSPRYSYTHHSHRHSRTNRHRSHTKHRDRRHYSNSSSSSTNRSTSSPSHQRKRHHRNRKKHYRRNACYHSHSHSNYYSKSYSPSHSSAHSRSHSRNGHISSREQPSDFNPEHLSPQPRTNLSSRGLRTQARNDILAKETKEARIDQIKESAFKEAVLNRLILSMERLQTHVCLSHFNHYFINLLLQM